MMRVQIGSYMVGSGEPCFIVGEIGINANGSLDLAKKLINVAAAAGCQAIKFQKRTVDVVYSAEELARPRESPFGRTNGDLKRGLEFGLDEYMLIDRYCKAAGILWFASCWDEQSVDFVEEFSPPCYKIASASLTDLDLLHHIVRKGKPILLSTGGSTMEQVVTAVSAINDEVPIVLLHTTSIYPAAPEQLNLRCIRSLGRGWSYPVGYSGHETGIAPTLAAVALGACVVERHITLDRAMYGSDQAASLEPIGLMRLVRDIRCVEAALGDGEKRVLPAEMETMRKLRRKL